MEILITPISFMLFLPLVVILLDLVLPVKIVRWLNIITIASLFANTLFFVRDLPLSFSLNGEKLYVLDDLSFFTVFFANLLGFVFSIYLLKTGIKKVHIYFILTVYFVNSALMSDNAILFLIFWGLSGLMLYLYGVIREEAAAISKKALLISGISDALLIFAFLIIISSTGLPLRMSGSPIGINGGWIVTAFIFIALASFAKAGAFPLHTWVPEYCEKSILESTFLLPASLDKLMGIYLFARLFMNFITPSEVLKIVMALLGALTIIAAVMMALIQHNGRKLLGYHAVSQVGYMVLGVATGNPIGIAGGLLHMVNHSIYKSGLFMGIGNVESQSGTSELEKIGGLSKKMPVTFIGTLVCSFSISGIPLTNGFVSKWLVYQGVLIAMVSSSYMLGVLYMICLVLALFGSALTFASFMKFIYSSFLSKRPKRLDGVKEVSIARQIALSINAGLCLMIGIGWRFFPLRFIDRILPVKQITPVGFYSSPELLSVIALSLLFGGLIYLIFKRVRFDEAFVGGQKDSASFKISGVDFFNEVEEMPPLKSIYTAAENKWFDAFELLKAGARNLAIPLRKLHTGELSFQLVWIVIGLFVFLFVMARGG
ncbi:proton-conducting transporter membrane subunit [Kosmotoga sp.]|uniref:complex I subunit 5 family protein n=1 Tax=Kosmotoga sp. TaxID=1955248 RepID=UPI0024AAC42F|nr:proton-conducting transporter membrane subunit [Kosmotoga sp.]MDI3523662.1 hydrogenase-4 component [Kosmotoga sp.]MDK2953787.1 hydrogenase-4 component [Kosmotoga sp.]